MSEPHFQMHRFGKGLKPLSPQLHRFLTIHQIYWSAEACPCLALEDQEVFGGVWSIISPIKHAPEMFSSALICRHCNSAIPVKTEVKYVEIKDGDLIEAQDQILADLPADPTVQ